MTACRKDSSDFVQSCTVTQDGIPGSRQMFVSVWPSEMRLHISAHSSGVLSVGRPMRDSCCSLPVFINHFPLLANFMSGYMPQPSRTPDWGGVAFVSCAAR